MNSPATFQMMKNDIFSDLIDKGVGAICMDDILIFSGQTKEQHHLYLKVEKFTFEQPTVEYLGLILL